MSEIQDTGQGSTQCPVCGAAGVPVGRFCSRCGAEMAASSGAGTLPPSVPVGAVSGTTHADTPPSGVGRVNQSLGDPAQQTAETLIIHPVPKRPQRIGLILAIAGAVMVVTAAAVGAAFLLASSSTSSTSTSSSTNRTAHPAKAGAGSGSSSAASAIDSVLRQSGNARRTVVAATQSVSNCTAGPASELSAMQGAISSRESALQRLSSIAPTDLPDGATLVSDVNSALKASDQADQDFVRWMHDIEGSSCPYVSSSDSNYQGATSASAQADGAKQALLSLWNPVAAQFGLTQYTAGQI